MRRREALALAGLFLLVFGLYLRTLSPAFAAGDSAETIACAATLGIQHPPGYPLHTLLGRLAVLLGPGPAPFDVNLLSAFLGALCAVEGACLLFCLAGEFAPWAAQRTMRGVFSLAGGLLLALVREIWSQSTIAKGGLYTLNLALTLGILLALLRVRDAALCRPAEVLRGEFGSGAWSLADCGCPAPRALQLAALLFGLALADHWTSQVVLVPAYALLLLEARWKRQAWPSLRTWAALLLRVFLPLACGFSLYLCLPLREGLGAPLVWGDLKTWRGFWFLFTRGQYAGVESGKTLTSVLAVFARLGQDALAGWTWAGLLALAPAWALLFRRRFWLACALFAVPLGLASGVVLKSKPPMDSLFLVDPYLLPLQAGLGLGLSGFFAVPRVRRFLAPALLLGALALGAWQWRNCDHRDDFLAWDYAHNLLLSAPKGAILVCQGDADVAGPLVPLLVYGRRPDLIPLTAVLCDQPWYRESVSRRSPGLRWPPFEGGPGADFGWMSRANAPRPLVWSDGVPAAWLDPRPLLPRGLVLEKPDRACPCPASRLSEARPWSAFALRGVLEPAGLVDELTRRLILGPYAHALGLLAAEEQAAGDRNAAQRDYRLSGLLLPGQALSWLLAGREAWRAGDFSGAERLWQRAASEEPGSAEAEADLGLSALKRGERGRALALARRALVLDPGLSDGRLLLQWITASRGVKALPLAPP